MSQLDDLLGGLLGGKSGGAGGLSDLLDELGGGGQGSGGGMGGEGGMLAALLPALGTMLANGGLNKVLAGFQQSGQGDKAASWVGTGANEPVSPGEVENALGSDEIDRIAGQLGVSREEAAEGIATVLPKLVDQVSPEGELPADPDLDRVFNRLSQASAPQ
jgi:uncharacterized protein YidB (DUF937 family)